MSLHNIPLLDENDKPISQTQDAHIKKFNELGIVMASLADYYDAGKSGDEALIASLRSDFSGWVVGSDRIIYSAESLDAKITRYFDSKFIKPVEVNVFIPDYSSGPTLDTVLVAPQGLMYVQALFNTSDDADTIKTTLTALSGKDSSNTRVWTPDQASRKSNPNRAAFLGCDDGSFRIGGSDDLGSSGRSRGVSLSPAGTAPKNASAQTKKSELVLPFELSEGIDKKSGCTYFTNHQRIGDYSRYAGLFCFYNNRFLLSMSVPRLLESESIDKKVSSVLAQDLPTSEKLGLLEKEYRPMYAHLQRYELMEGKGFVCADDSESFGEPRIREVKK